MAGWPPDATVMDWLLEPEDAAVRHLALRDLLDRPPDDPEVKAVRKAAHQSGPISTLLDAMNPEGWWVKPGFGYSPKYKSTVWAMISLGMVGASAAEDARIARACAYLLDHTVRVAGREGGHVDDRIPNMDCLQGNLVAALLRMGCDDPRLAGAIEWTARAATGEGVALASNKNAPLRFAPKGNIGPGFQCTHNWDLPCAWGAIKVLSVFAELPVERRTPQVQAAIGQGAEFLLGTDPVRAEYPTQTQPSPRWWQFTFPLYYPADLLQLVEALAGLGYGADPRLARALEAVRQRADATGRWPLEHRFYSQEWIDWGRRGKPNKWVTLRALRALKAAAN
jgi:hypothetical protein